MKEKSQFLRYAIVGLIGTGLHTSILVLLVENFSLNPLFSTSTGFIASFIVSYCLNYKWTFRSQLGHFGVLIRYFAVSISGLVLNLLIMFTIVNILKSWYIIGQIISIIVIPISNYLLNSRWSFKD